MLVGQFVPCRLQEAFILVIRSLVGRGRSILSFPVRSQSMLQHVSYPLTV